MRNNLEHGGVLARSQESEFFQQYLSHNVNYVNFYMEIQSIQQVAFRDIRQSVPRNLPASAVCATSWPRGSYL